MANERITIKGTSNGLIVTIGAGLWEGLVVELDQRLGEKASFFKGGRVALNVGPRQLTRPQIESIGQVLNRHHVTLWAVRSDSAGTQEAAAQLGLETELEPSLRQTVSQPEPPALQGNALFIQRTLRSGQVIHHPGHVVIIGDVNPGAEIQAGGSVVVWGRLRGIVQAGAGHTPEENVVVCALQLSPTQLRIGDHITRSPTDDPDREIMPEMASIQDGQIVAEPWRQTNK